MGSGSLKQATCAVNRPCSRPEVRGVPLSCSRRQRGAAATHQCRRGTLPGPGKQPDAGAGVAAFGLDLTGPCGLPGTEHRHFHDWTGSTLLTHCGMWRPRSLSASMKLRARRSSSRAVGEEAAGVRGNSREPRSCWGDRECGVGHCGERNRFSCPLFTWPSQRLLSRFTDHILWQVTCHRAGEHGCGLPGC